MDDQNPEIQTAILTTRDLLTNVDLRRSIVQMANKAYIDHKVSIVGRYLSDMEICHLMGSDGLCAVVLVKTPGGSDLPVACACVKRWIPDSEFQKAVYVRNIPSLHSSQGVRLNSRTGRSPSVRRGGAGVL